MSTNYVVYGERIAIRKMEFEDCGMIVNWRNKDRVRSNYIYREKISLSEQEKYYREQVQTGKVYHYVCCLRENDRPFGCMVLKDMREEERQIEFGSFIGEDDCVGLGLGGEISVVGYRYVFDNFPVDRIVLEIMADNKASMFSHGKGGAKPYKKADAVMCSDGIRRDMVLYEVWRDDMIAGSKGTKSGSSLLE